MEAKVSEVLENILSLLSLEGSFEVEETPEGVFVSIDTNDPGRIIGRNGETLSALQLIVNQITFKQSGDASKRVIIDIANWRKSKEEELAHKARLWATEVIETNKPLELESMPSWQRRVVHMVIQETPGVASESFGEGIERHLIISPAVSADSLLISPSDQKDSDKSGKSENQ